jgi:hypothetical protein
MSKLQVPEFKTYEEEAAFCDNLDSAPYMEDDGEWFRFEISETNVEVSNDTSRNIE